MAKNEGKSYRLALLSDSHDNGPALSRALTELASHDPHLYIHCGDVTSPGLLRAFSGLNVRVVLGNNDFDLDGLSRVTAEIGAHSPVETLELELAGRRMWIYHGTSPSVLRSAVSSGQYDYVFHGHTHVQRDELDGRTRVINPGALWRARVYSVAIVDIVNGSCRFLEIGRGG
jgi:hypothetical protein